MNLREAREREGLTLEELAHGAGLSPKTVWNVEVGKHRPHNETKRRILIALGIPWARRREIFG